MFTAALTNVVTVDVWRLPPLETLLVMKFMAATSPFRGLDRRRQDMLDLVRLYRTTEPNTLDRDRIDELARTIYGGAEEELRELLLRIDRDDPISI